MKRLRRLEVKSAYDFYEAPEETRLSLVGEFYLVEKDEPKDPVDRYPEWMYFPIQLTEEGSYYNYGVRQALILVTSVMKYKDSPWFRVAAFSPDDLDMDLDFNNENKIRSKRKAIIEYFLVKRKRDLTNVSYDSVLQDIKDKFGGERTS